MISLKKGHDTLLHKKKKHGLGSFQATLRT